MAAEKWASRWANKHVIIQSDSQAAVGIINQGSTRNGFVMSWLRRLFWLSAIYNFRITARHIKGADNVTADAISRMHIRNFLLRAFSLLTVVTLVSVLICSHYYVICLMPVHYFSPLSTLAHSLANDLRQEIFHLRSFNFAESTKTTYRSHRDSFLRFCLFMGYQPLPASTYVICQYAAFLARSLKYNSIRSYLGITGLLHKEFGLANPLTGNWMVQSLLTGIKRVKGNQVKQKLPITLSILKGTFKLLKPRNSFDASCWAVCLVVFYGFFRKSHLLPLSPAKYDLQKQFSMCDFKFLSWGALVKIKWSKAIHFRERTIHILLPYTPQSPLCPVTSILHAMSFTSSVPQTFHTFAYFDAVHLRCRVLTYRACLSKLRECLQALGYSPQDYAGHSFRRGGASFVHQSGYLWN